MKSHIRSAAKEDALAIHNLHTRSVRALCSGHYSTEIIEGWLKGRTPEGYKGLQRNEMFVFEKNGKIAGFSHVIPGEIVAIFVDPVFDSQGIGRTLLEHAIPIAKKSHDGPVLLYATLNAQAFYEKFGFIEVEKKTIHRNDVDMPVASMTFDNKI